MATQIQKDAQVNLQLRPNGTATLTVDGVDLSKLMRRVEIDMRAGQIANMVIHCNVRNGQIDGVADAVTVTTGERKPRTVRRNADGSPILPPCEVCGQPSDIYQVDELDVTPLDAKAKSFAPLYPVHYFCNEHHRKPLEFSLHQPVFKDEDD